jgi:hypothetical protein
MVAAVGLTTFSATLGTISPRTLLQLSLLLSLFWLYVSLQSCVNEKKQRAIIGVINKGGVQSNREV